MTRSQPMRLSQFRIRLVPTGRGCGGSWGSGGTAGRPPRGTPRIAKENREAVGCHSSHSAVSFWMFFEGFLKSRGISHSFYHVSIMWLFFPMDFPFGFCPRKELLVDVGWNFPFLNDFECCFELFTTCSRWVLGFVLGIAWIMETANHWYHLATKDAEWGSSSPTKYWTTTGFTKGWMSRARVKLYTKGPFIVGLPIENGDFP